jgi:hypothetical protein
VEGAAQLGIRFRRRIDKRPEAGPGVDEGAVEQALLVAVDRVPQLRSIGIVVRDTARVLGALHQEHAADAAFRPDEEVVASVVALLYPEVRSRYGKVVGYDPGHCRNEECQDYG